MKPRQRLTAATARRVESMKRLVAEMAVRDMTLADVGYWIDMSPSGARKYIYDLVGAGLVTQAGLVNPTRYSLGKPSYRLTDDAGAVASFLAEIEMPDGSPIARPSPKQAGVKLAAGRHVHIMGDDVHYAVRLSKSVPVRDSLVAALFGPGAA